ncbi:hypothetical protein CAPTEDRAFT_195210 [Capitella teleta]|uniref:RAP domain-containing protein n=1 Tax=Capitella teleta TaxID=283909 RepID=R7U238_CAPTE|nr:hypothetical protein CAPTEDRAFT_195210 [Capitella teleta]|eukprot:ELU00055.1 hypothetical protein CAPTEDRAFT_195210 [Capitella teleta]
MDVRSLLDIVLCMADVNLEGFSEFYDELLQKCEHLRLEDLTDSQALDMCMSYVLQRRHVPEKLVHLIPGSVQYNVSHGLTNAKNKVQTIAKFSSVSPSCNFVEDDSEVESSMKRKKKLQDIVQHLEDAIPNCKIITNFTTDRGIEIDILLTMGSEDLEEPPVNVAIVLLPSNTCHRNSNSIRGMARFLVEEVKSEGFPVILIKEFKWNAVPLPERSGYLMNRVKNFNAYQDLELSLSL